MKKLRSYYLILFCWMLLSSGNLWSQISFTEDFEDGAEGWYDPDAWYYVDVPFENCGNLAYITSLYSDYAGFEETSVSPSIGISNGAQAVIAYDYKLVYFGNPFLPLENEPDWGTIKVEYATSETGPWTTIDVVTPEDHIVSTTCATRTSTFTPEAGSNIYIRLNVEVNPDPTAGVDGQVYIDNIAVTQGELCATPAPEDIMDPQTVCSGTAITDLNTDGYDEIVWYDSEDSTEPLTGDTLLEAGTYYAAQAPIGECESLTRTAVTVSFNIVAVPEVDSPQVFEDSMPIVVMLYDIDVDAEGTIAWYATEENAEEGESVLPENTEVSESGTYYITQTIDGCESEPVAVLIDIILGNDGFSGAGFSYYPNPVKDRLTLSYGGNITALAVYNMLGQQVIKNEVNGNEAVIDMASLSKGTYLVKVEADNAVRTVRIIKQ